MVCIVNDFIGGLNLPIALRVSWCGVSIFNPKLSTLPLECFSIKLEPGYLILRTLVC